MTFPVATSSAACETTQRLFAPAGERNQPGSEQRASGSEDDLQDLVRIEPMDFRNPHQPRQDGSVLVLAHQDVERERML